MSPHLPEPSGDTELNRLLIIHLSDLHVDGTDASLSQRVDSVIPALQSVEPDVATVIVVVSGDVAWSGKSEQYEIAGDLLLKLMAQIREKLGAGSVSFVMVPGNHDCLFEGSQTVRDMIITQILNSGSAEPKIDENVVSHCCSIQIPFFEFNEALTDHGNIENKLGNIYWERSLTIGDRIILFRCYNTAWISSLHEKSGNLYFPVHLTETTTSGQGPDYVTSVLHHPYNWFRPNNNRALNRQIRISSDLVLTGHEHESDQYVRRTLSLSEESLYIEGAIFGGKPNGAEYGFSAIWVDFESKQQRVETYRWDGSSFRASGQDTAWMPFRRGIRQRGDCELSADQLQWLDDAGTSFLHPQRGILSLSDIFIPPSFREILSDKTPDSNGRRQKGGREFISQH